MQRRSLNSSRKLAALLDVTLLRVTPRCMLLGFLATREGVQTAQERWCEPAE